MNPLQIIAENRIREAMEKGEFDNLPGQGKPIDFSEYEKIPPEYRMAYQILKNAGEVETEADILKHIRALKQEAKELSEDSKAESVARLIRYREAQLEARRKHSRANKGESSHF